MKKALSLLLALVLCLSLCACGSSNDASKTLSNDEIYEKALVGEWSSHEKSGFVLLSSGKVLQYSNLSGAADNVSSGISAGTWEVENGYLIIFTENYNAYQSAWVYRIIDTSTLERNGVKYSKA